MVTACQSLDGLEVMFDDERAVANAGLVLPATLAVHLGLEQAANRLVSLSGPGYFAPGRKAMTLVHSMIAGGDCIDDVDVLRAGQTEAVLGHRVMAPSTCGTFLRAFTFGHVRQLDAWSEFALCGAWAAGAGPGSAPMTIDIDSTICETHGYQKQGATFGYTKRRGYHPLLATRADTGEVLHVRFRKGSANTGRGAERFVREVIGRVRRAGAAGPLLLRADSGFWSKKVIRACREHGVGYSITVRQIKTIKTAIAAIDDTAWVPIDYTASGDAEVAECPYGDGHRLVVRRTRIVGAQPELFDNWRHHAFITDSKASTVDADEAHRAHAVIELAIRDLKDGAGLDHCPSGRFGANGAWAVLATVAHNLLRWVHLIGTATVGPIVAKTIRRRLLTIPGRITRGGRRRHLHLPARWPWTNEFGEILQRLRTIPRRC
ncbi:MAG: IS1380 family transposase [Acidimicrobiales bacterium]|nr:IS1380 family transposase [Acidimicrobiales bacterium]